MDPQERRSVVLEELRRWREEGLLDEDTVRRLAARYEGTDASFAPTAPGRGGFAANALQFVGGLLLGAALVALVVFLEVSDEGAPWALLGLGVATLGGAVALRVAAPEREGLVEALLSAGLIPVGVAAGFAMDEGNMLWVAFLVAGLAAGVHVLRRGRGPSIVVAGAVYSFGSFAAADVPFIFGEPDLVRVGFWLLALLGYFALLLLWRDEGWSSVALALFVGPLAFAFALLMDVLGVNGSTAMELLMGAWLGAFLAVGVLVRNRGLVTGAAAGLTIDAVAFAFDLGGPGTAVVVLLALGGLLVWQAEFLRAWFGRGAERL